MDDYEDKFSLEFGKFVANVVASISASMNVAIKLAGAQNAPKLMLSSAFVMGMEVASEISKSPIQREFLNKFLETRLSLNEEAKESRNAFINMLSKAIFEETFPTYEQQQH